MTLKDCVWCGGTEDLDNPERRRNDPVRLERFASDQTSMGLLIGGAWRVIDEPLLTVAEGFWCTHECFIRWVEWQLHRAKTERAMLIERQAR